MAISQLSLTDFRNLKSTTLEFHPRINLISGDNGSGKTSLLEAIHVLCRAGSFRTHWLKQCIHHDRDGFLLFGRFSQHKVGLAKSSARFDIKLDGELLKRRSDLVRLTPVSVLNTDSFDLLQGSPAIRRKFIDWALFHVEPEYAELWRRYQHAMKQRNRLLKTSRDLKQLGYWDEFLVDPCTELQQMRRRLVERLRQASSDHSDPLLEGLEIELEYRPGWPDEMSLLDAFRQYRDKDLKSGFTQVGPHRDQLLLRRHGVPAHNVLSRGQSKRLCMSLILSALRMVSESTQNRAIMLVDDLNSELDSRAQAIIYRHIVNLDLQLFISNVEGLVPGPFEAKEFKMFHVEHGTIKPRNFS